MENDIKKIDTNMAWLPANGDGLKWYLPYEAPMKIVGLAWFDQFHNYQRLPDPDPESTVTQFPGGVPTTIPVAQCGAFMLSPQTAGAQVRFRTDSTSVSLQGATTQTGGMDHMAFTGSGGFDVYMKWDGGPWKCFGVTRTDHSKCEFSATIVTHVEKTMHDVIINFPLYNGVKNLAVGLDEGAKVEAATPFQNPKPIVWYGTSIQQGGCATRPGMASSNILSRMLDQEIINLGFSGNGKGEPEIAKILAGIDASAYLLDYCWNVDAKGLEASLPGFIDIIRANHPDVPIILIAPTPGTNSIPEIHSRVIDEKSEVMQKEWEKRVQAGDKNIYFFDTLNGALGEDFWECTVDGVHLTDMGFYRFTQAFYPFLGNILGR